MQPLSARITQALYALLEEDERTLALSEQEHRKTHDVLRRVVLGELSASRVVVKHDGWEILPEVSYNDHVESHAD